MDGEQPPSPVLFFETLNAYQKSGALKAALELDLFTAIGSATASVSEIATRCNAAERGVRILCDYLTIDGFLVKQGERYSLTRDSAMFLDRNSPAYAGSAAQFLLAPTLTNAFAELAESVRKGGTAQSDQGTMAPDHPVWIDFARSMGAMAAPAAEDVAELLSLDSASPAKVLDISASHGLYGIAFAQRYPAARVVAVDWAPVLQVAHENAERLGVADRFSTIIGNAFEVDLGSDYDVILIPNFLHHFDTATCVAFLRRVHAALKRAGGRAAIVEFVSNDDRITPPPAAAFSLVMLATTAAGDAYTFAEFERMLRDAGFGEVERHALAPGVQTLIIAGK